MVSIVSECPTASHFKRFVDDKLTFRETWITTLHCKKCHSCANKLIIFFVGKKISVILKESKQTSHLTEEQIGAYQNNKLSDQEQDKLILHCVTCEKCRELHGSKLDQHC